MNPLDRIRGKPLLVDTNLMVLYCIGKIDPAIIPKHRRVNHFTPNNWTLLRNLMTIASELLTTPHVLAEVSNLLGQSTQRDATKLRQQLGIEVATLGERFEAATTIAKRSAFPRVGLADAAITQLATDGVVVLTTDARLVSEVAAAGGDAINFNHLIYPLGL